MRAKEVASKDWETFCRRISELRHEATVTIEIVRPDGQRDHIARNVPLQQMKFEISPGCSDQLRIDVGADGEKPTSHVIVEPIHLILRPADEESFNPLEIAAESGTTLVSFRPALRANLVEGMVTAGGR